MAKLEEKGEKPLRVSLAPAWQANGHANDVLFEGQYRKAKANLLRLRQDIPLADAELSAVEDALTAYEKLLEKLADVPTPAGPTPRQLGREHLVQLQVGEQPTQSDDRRLPRGF